MLYQEELKEPEDQEQQKEQEEQAEREEFREQEEQEHTGRTGRAGRGATPQGTVQHVMLHVRRRLTRKARKFHLHWELAMSYIHIFRYTL